MKLVAALAGLALAVAGPAVAEPYVPIKGAAGPGPAQYNQVFVQKFGPDAARRVLVLVPGFQGGAGEFTLVARELVQRVPDLQVWALDRREQAFEDTSVFAAGDPQAALDYYLNFRPVGGRLFEPVDDTRVPFVREWGLKLALEDLRRVVLAGRDGGRRKVILGGHSLGAATAVAYASWDFAGRAGYRDLSGLVLIDGGELGTFWSPTLDKTKASLAGLRKGSPFFDPLGLGLPWIGGAFAETSALYALGDPQGPSVVQQHPLLPVNALPPVRVTNEAFVGWLFDRPNGDPVLHARSGELAPEGDPRPWLDTKLTPVQRLAQIFGQEPANAVEWYFPTRLLIDMEGADALARNPTTDLLGLRLWHRREVNLPLYALETGLTGGRVLRGARRFIAGSHAPRDRAMLVADHDAGHLDPVTAAPDRNRFLQTVVPFLQRLR